MQRPGRKPRGARHVDNLSGSQRAKSRLEVMLKTMLGEMTVPEACRRLGIGESRFHALRNQWLQEALELLEPRPLGRPSNDPSPENNRIAELEKQVSQLQQELTVSEVRAQLAGVLPHLMEDSAESPKKGAPNERNKPRGPRRKPH